MDIRSLPTPLVLVDIDKLYRNLQRFFERARRQGKKLWPMVKTHKSTYIARIQRELGADGFSVGTLDEAEVLVEKGLTKTIMCGNVYVADRESLMRVIRLMEAGARVILRIDNRDAAEFVDRELRRYGVRAEYVVKVDTGRHRFGVRPENVARFVKGLQGLNNLKFVGVATFSGHAYSAPSPEGVEAVARGVARTMNAVASELRREGFELEIVGVGSTPTFRFDVEDPVFTHLFPGNFLYFDREQAEVFGSASLDDCALTVLSTVVSIPEHSSGKLAMINAGSKYLGLDRVERLEGYGRLLEHPKALVIRPSEEVSEVDISKEPGVRVGEKVRIIPNHACVVSNATSYLVACGGEKVVGIIEVDMRNGIRLPRVIVETLLRSPQDSNT
jgi:D-serine deaminase-like pyridoxal phosphate-dependent protein